jgi:hypothetical protein
MREHTERTRKTYHETVMPGHTAERAGESAGGAGTQRRRASKR